MFVIIAAMFVYVFRVWGLKNTSNRFFHLTIFHGICCKHGQVHFPNFVNSQSVFMMLIPANKGTVLFSLTFKHTFMKTGHAVTHRSSTAHLRPKEA